MMPKRRPDDALSGLPHDEAIVEAGAVAAFFRRCQVAGPESTLARSSRATRDASGMVQAAVQ